jgi:hypothetical protein
MRTSWVLAFQLSCKFELVLLTNSVQPYRNNPTFGKKSNRNHLCPVQLGIGSTCGVNVGFRGPTFERKFEMPTMKIILISWIS